MTHATGIRLVSLMEALSGAEDALEIQVRVLTDAASVVAAGATTEQGKSTDPNAMIQVESAHVNYDLYFATPPDMQACAETRASPDGDFISPGDFRVVVDPWIPTRADIEFPRGHTEIRFLALNPEHIKSLKEEGRVDVQWFAYGLRLHPGAQQQRQGLYVEAPLSRPLYLRRTAHIGRRVKSLIEQHVYEYPAVTMRVELKDVYVDECNVVRLLPNKSPSTPEIESDPYNLKSRAPGLYSLFQVARTHFREPLRPKEKPAPRRKKALEELRIRGPEKLFNKTNRPHAARLADPDAKRNHGLQNGQRRDFTAKALHILNIEYANRERFVSPALALVIHATGLWLGWRKERPSDGTSALLALTTELKSYGFDGVAEMKAILAFITWKPK
ncbi:hypothetical protein ASD55_11705 [Rhodanobacter sp. Root561]|uniref:hypothetical protein n=1 Tax=Rhodanobacter sp. Root561 TaxID=1736560 RepID=UPI0006F46DB0|nr:hypothetical protein [Rhodanobacter sp. Root561]KQZ72415.1 hypothetical protein ASD55_11705 [Rhodanobacter sp. Root561]